MIEKVLFFRLIKQKVLLFHKHVHYGFASESASSVASYVGIAAVTVAHRHYGSDFIVVGKRPILTRLVLFQM